MASPPGFLTTTIDGIANWARSQSSWPATFGLACCAVEIATMATLSQ